MRTGTVVMLLTTCSALALAPIACRHPTAPDDSRFPPVSAVRLEIVGPSTVAPNSTTQYRATFQATDGTVRDITSPASWQSSDASVLAITATGLATARSLGESQISMNSGTLRTGLEVLVLPPGTYRVSGTVQESGLPVVGAKVEVAGSADTAASTDASGSYRLYGVAGDVQLRVTKNGYRPQSTSLTVTENQNVHFALEQLSEPTDLAGAYGLTITADLSCHYLTGILQEDPRTRTYDAVVTQDGPRLTVQLGGALFLRRGSLGDNFTGRVSPDGVTFFFSGFDDFYYNGVYYNLVEILNAVPQQLLIVSGTVAATASPKSHIRSSGRLHRSENQSHRNRLVVVQFPQPSARAAPTVSASPPRA